MARFVLLSGVALAIGLALTTLPSLAQDGGLPAQEITAATTDLNRDQAAAAAAQDAENVAQQQAFERANAQYLADVAVADAARQQYEADLAANNLEQAEYSRAQAAYDVAYANWQEDVRACQAGNNSHCDSTVPAALATGTPTGRDTCRATRRGAAGLAVLGGVAAAVGGRRLGNIARFLPVAAVATVLTSAIACHLDEPEQIKAADATLQATRSEEVGAQVAWQSETREDVRGTTTVVALDDTPTGLSQGSRCMLIDDVIIINGEETVSQKRMCRVPPQTRYALAV